jgi:hypothetical protein
MMKGKNGKFGQRNSVFQYLLEPLNIKGYHVTARSDITHLRPGHNPYLFGDCRE